MKTATSIREMKTSRLQRTAGMSLMELLVVISIIATVAGLVVGLSGVASQNKNFKRTQAELAKVTTLIEEYRTKVGFYPPDHPSSPGTNSLLYELAGAIRDRGNVANPNYVTPFGNITSNEIWIAYGGDNVFPPPNRSAGLINAREKEGNPDDAPVRPILKNLAKDQAATVAGHLSLVVPVDGAGGRPNPWKYLRGDNAVHNKDTFDLWVEIKSADGLRTVGNWKD